MKFVYLTDGSKLNVKSADGILRKLHLFFRMRSKKGRIEKLSDLYDNRLVNIGELAVVWNPDRLSSLDLADYCKQRNIYHLCLGEVGAWNCRKIENKYGDGGVHFYDGTNYRFAVNSENLCRDILEDRVYVFAVSSDSSVEQIISIAQNLRYAGIYSEDADCAAKFADELYRKTGLIADIIQDPFFVKEDMVFLIMPGVSFPGKYEGRAIKPDVRDMTAKTADTYKVYSTLIGELFLDESCLEYMLFREGC